MCIGLFPTLLFAQIAVKIDTVYNVSQAASSTVNYQIAIPYPGQITIHIKNWLSTYDWTHDYDRMYVYNDTAGLVDREGLSTSTDPFLFHMFQADSNGLTFNIGQAAVYTIAVHAGDYLGQQPQTQSYQMSITEVSCSDAYEPNDTRQLATALTMDSTITAYQWRRVKTAQVGGDEDWYKIAVPSPGQLKIVLSHWTPVMDWTNDFDRLYVYNGKGDSIGSGISTGSSTSDPYYEHMMYDSIHTTSMNLSHAGTYYLRYHSGAASSLKPYTITPSFTAAQDQFEPNDNFSQAKQIAASDSFYHACEWRSADSTMNVAGDEDYYFFMAASGGEYSLTLQNWIGIYNWDADYDYMVVYASDTSVVGANPMNWMMNANPTTFTVPSAGKYYIRLHCGNAFSLTGYSFKLSGNTVPIKAVKKNIPKDFALGINSPNPFVSNTSISYRIPQDCTVRIKIFDNRGREIKELVNEYKTAGAYTVCFNGAKLSGGVYFYEISAGKFFDRKKMSLLK
jgi:hypothetical protein